MKKLLLATLLMCGLTAQAETVGDTLVVKNVDKVTIETTDTVQHISLRGSNFNSNFKYDQRIAIKDTNDVRRSFSSLRDFNKVRLSKKKGAKNKKNTWETSLHMWLGLETMTGVKDDAVKAANVPDWSFKLWPSFEFGLGVTFDYYPFGNKNCWSIGMGLNWKNYRLSKDAFIVKDETNRMMLEPYDSHQTNRRTSLNITSFQIPVIYTHNFDNDEKWSLSLGAIVNFNYRSYAFRKFTAGGEDFQAERHDMGVRQITFDFVAAVDAPYIPRLYLKYSPSNALKSGRGPKMHHLSFGICF